MHTTYNSRPGDADMIREHIEASKRPECYAGYWPGEHGYLLVSSQHRDSDALERSNFQCMQETLEAMSEDIENPGMNSLYGRREGCDTFPDWQVELLPDIGTRVHADEIRDLLAIRDRLAPAIDRIDEPDGLLVLVAGASHWAVGWSETLWVRADAVPLVLQAHEFAIALADYPVLDESHYCELEHDELCDAIRDWYVHDVDLAVSRAGNEPAESVDADYLAWAVGNAGMACRPDDLYGDAESMLEIAWEAYRLEFERAS